ncbi:hypothetical protein Tco_0540407 [Tanacetum coccineum]
MDEEKDNEVTKELYDDVNVNLGNKDTEMTNADQGASEQQNVSQESGFKQVEEDAHVTLTPLLDTQKADEPLIMQQQFLKSHQVSLQLFLHHLHSSNPLSQQATPTPTPTPTASKTTTSLPALPDFAFVFKFNERVSNLEKDLSEMKQVDQYAKALSSIPTIVDRYIDNKLREAINKAIQAHNFSS